MQPVDEAVDDGSREQFQVADPRKRGGIDEPRPWHRRVTAARIHGYIPERGTGTASSS